MIVKTKQSAMTRELWLQHAADLIRRTVKGAGVVVPPVQISCSWPGDGSRHQRIGECWPTGASKAGVNEVFVSPKLEDPVKVVAVLCHELAHAVDDNKSGHGKNFVQIASAMGCVGKPTQMMPPEALAEAWAAVVTAKCGPFPHRTVDQAKSGKKKQVSRQLKAECLDCGAIWRMSAKHMLNVRMCPCCGSANLSNGNEEENDDA